MNEIRESFDVTASASEITEILACFQSAQTPLESKTRSPSDAIQVLRISEFEDLEEFRAAYEATRQPSLCLVQADQVVDLLGWIRSGDDLALADSPSELIHWRRKRISQSLAQRLDPLTRVYQRNYLMDLLKSGCGNASPATPISLILLDIDRFKELNDQYGPAGGNTILQHLGELIQQLCETAVVARTRGGEFVVVTEAPEAPTGRVANLIHEALNATSWCLEKGVTCSLGVATVAAPCPPSKLLTLADEALYSAKANGRNRVVCYSQIAEISDRVGEDMDVISLENKARVMTERVTSFVTQQSKLIMRNLRHEANTDGLTELFNRRYLDKKLADEVHQSHKTGQALSIGLVDVDHFGEVNKKHGWPTGDEVLRQIARLIQNSVRGRDWVGRYGGEEICIVMPGTCQSNAFHVCDRIRKAIQTQAFSSESGDSFRVTLSIGVVQWRSEEEEDVQALYQRVSRKTLEAKSDGRNCVRS